MKMRTGDTLWSQVILATTLLTTSVVGYQSRLQGPTCADGSNGKLYGHDDIAACSGFWYGHISNSSHLCASGWKVCEWRDTGLLGRVRWEEAVSVEGCYAYNAAHDGGRCRPCGDHLEKDDMGGIGRGCPHQNFEQTSCITGGRIDSSCCVDAHFKSACQHRPHITGVMCCRLPSNHPRIVVKPQPMLDVNTGRIILITCQATGNPPPRVMWYKDGKQISKGNKRIQTLPSGDLLVTLARKSDSGLYSCEVINRDGMDMASSHVIVQDYRSGCRDGSTEGLELHKDIHACAGKWAGHVKKGRSLCQKGWKVCSPRDKQALGKLTWLDVFELDGCFAYNAANYKGKCQRCHRGNMAGFGKKCGRLRYSQNSCLAQGRIDVFKAKDKSKGCSYKEGLTSGVLCCRRKSRKSGKPPIFKPVCRPSCVNGGKCVAYNTCMCPPGYKGAMCQNAVCNIPCGPRATCVSPGKCKCKSGYTGKGCKRKVKHMCKYPCLNGGRCRKGRCKCPPTHTGKSCQYLLDHLKMKPSHLNRTER